jgi:GTPase SAR1 family protein
MCFVVVCCDAVSIRSHSTNSLYSFKLILAGDSEVGKSCLMTRFVEDRFSDIHATTIGFDYVCVHLNAEGKGRGYMFGA